MKVIMILAVGEAGLCPNCRAFFRMSSQTEGATNVRLAHTSRLLNKIRVHSALVQDYTTMTWTRRHAVLCAPLGQLWCMIALSAFWTTPVQMTHAYAMLLHFATTRARLSIFASVKQDFGAMG